MHIILVSAKFHFEKYICKVCAKIGYNYLKSYDQIHARIVSDLSDNVHGSYYQTNPKYWEKQACTNSVDPDQTPQNATCHHCLPPIRQFLDISPGTQMDLLKFKGKSGKVLRCPSISSKYGNTDKLEPRLVKRLIRTMAPDT